MNKTDISFMGDTHNPQIVVYYPNGIYRYYGFEYGEFLLLKKKSMNNILKHLKSKYYIKCDKLNFKE